MAKVILASALLSLFLFNGCGFDYDVSQRIGGDVSGFLIPDYSTRFYSGSSADMTIQSAGDTLIENQNFKTLYFDYTQRHFLFTEQYIYERFELSGMPVTVPFMSRILIEGMKDYRIHEGDLYSYSFSFGVDSFGDFSDGEKTFENAYFVTSSVSITSEVSDTSFTNRFILTHGDGMVGIMKDSLFLYLDSVIVY